MDLHQLFRTKAREAGEEEVEKPAPIAEAPRDGDAAPRAIPAATQPPRWRLDRAAGGLIQRVPLPPAGTAQTTGSVTLSLEEVLRAVPTEAVKPGLHDPDRLLSLPVPDLAAALAAGKVAVPLSVLARACPEIFEAPTGAEEEVAVPLPVAAILQRAREAAGAAPAQAPAAVAGSHSAAMPTAPPPGMEPMATLSSSLTAGAVPLAGFPAPAAPAAPAPARVEPVVSPVAREPAPVAPPADAASPSAKAKPPAPAGEGAAAASPSAEAAQERPAPMPVLATPGRPVIRPPVLHSTTGTSQAGAPVTLAPGSAAPVSPEAAEGKAEAPPAKVEAAEGLQPVPEAVPFAPPEPPTVWAEAPQEVQPVPIPPPAEEELPRPSYPAISEQAPLQAIFMTEEELDLPRITELSSCLPGVLGCMLLVGEHLVQGGERPAGLDATTLRALSQQMAATIHAFQDKLPAEPSVTLYGGNRALSLFTRPELCLCVVHGARGFLPGVRERLTAVADTLARDGALLGHGE